MKFLLIGTLIILNFLSGYSQTSQLIEQKDIDGFQYKTVEKVTDSISSILYYSRREYVMASVCSVKDENDILNRNAINQLIHYLVRGETPMVRCGKRTIVFAFLYTGDGDVYDEVRILQCDYKINNIKRFEKKLKYIVTKIKIQPEDPNCFYLYEIKFSVEGICNILRKKRLLDYKE